MQESDASPERALHIVHVLTRLLRAGTEENTIALARRQVADGHRVTFIHGGQYSLSLRAELKEEFTVLQASSLVHRIAPLADFKALLDLRTQLKRLAPDVVHTHQSKAGVVASIAAAMLKIPAVVHGVHILPWVNTGTLRSAAYVGMERIAAGASGAFVNVSAGVRDECLRHGIGKPEEHFVAHSPIDLALYRAAQPAEDVVPKDEAGRSVVVLVLAAFEPRKRQEAFLHALASMEGSSDLTILFAGDGPTLPFVAKAAERLFPAGQVRFLGHRKDPERLVALADICVLTSSREGLPRVLLQYLAGGRASVVTDLPGLGDVVKNGENAVIAPSVDAAANEVIALAKDSARRGQLAEAARATDLSGWGLDQIYPAVMRAYEFALARRKAA